MPEPITPEQRLSEIRERHEAATDGPWWFDESDTCWRLHGVMGRIPPLRRDGFIPGQVMNKQILKAAKQGTPYAEYWPDKADAAFISHAWEDVRDLLAEVDRLRAGIVALDRLDRAAIGDWEREVDRLKEVAHNQARMISEITSACMAAETERDARLAAEDVERFLKRERDEHAKGSLAWRDLDDVLDCFRLHMVTGTPLTEPRPEEGPTDPSAGAPPLTEAEELRAEVERLNAAVDLLGRELQKGSADVMDALREAAAEMRADGVAALAEASLAVARWRQGDLDAFAALEVIETAVSAPDDDVDDESQGGEPRG